MKRALLALGLLLQACASGTPTTNEYLLRDATAPAPTRAGTAEVALNSVWVAPYLDRAGIVVETAPLQIVEARYERWAEPLGESLRRLLQVEIARTAGVVDTAAAGREGSELGVDVSVHEFHGDISGTARLIAEWTLQGRQGAARRFQFARSEQTQGDGYPALVASQLSLARQLGAAIGQSTVQHRAAATAAAP